MREHDLDIGALHIHYYQVDGQSPGAVFIHGWASSGRMWESSLQHLEGRLTCIALDLPGHGLSDKPHYDWYTLSNFVSVLRDFTEAVGTSRPALVGHSMGGTIALEYARRHPRSVDRIVLVNPVITGRLYFDLPWLSRRLPGRWVLAITRRLWPRASARMRERIAREQDGGRSGGYLQRNRQDLALTTADSLLGSARAVARSDLSSHLDSIHAPTLVIVGKRDPTVPPREGGRAARSLPWAQLAELPAGHLPFDETPERFLATMTPFLLEPTGSRADPPEGSTR
jgi:pimeloyl-ACP methyl ester carboxylesterase